jgi:hypothetical protein
MTERTAYMIEIDGGMWGWNIQHHNNGGPMIFLNQRAAEWWASNNLQQFTYRIVPRQVMA